MNCTDHLVRSANVTPASHVSSKRHRKIPSLTRELRACLVFLADFLVLLVTLGVSSPACAQSPDTLTERIEKIISRPEFKHANFGIEFYCLDTGKVVYALSANKLFLPASTTKTLTEGTMLAKLGADYRFHTRVFRTGPVDSKGRLRGDIVLVASGDPNLSNRIRPDGTLAFVDQDHSYNGPAVSGDPLQVIKKLARDVAGKGIHEIDGDVLIDTTMLPDGPREEGTNAIMSSIMVNDNFVDLVGKPGAKPGDLATVESSPLTSYVKFVNHVVTGSPGTRSTFNEPEVVISSDGVVATLSGNLAVDGGSKTMAFAVPSPTLFAQAVLREALTAEGIKTKDRIRLPLSNVSTFSRFYTPVNQLTEHVSLPLAEEIKVTLKVSQNLHADMAVYLLGTLVAKDKKDPLTAGFNIEHAFLQEASLDLSGAAQGDGSGGDWADLFSPDFMCHYLAYWTRRPDFQSFLKALPILGKDGTLAKIQTNSAAAGHVFAKTGTFISDDKLGGKPMLNAKGLAGYVMTLNGQTLVFAAYVNHVSLSNDPDAAQQVAGQALGEIAAAAFDAPLDSVQGPIYDLIIRNGHIIDGTGNPWFAADVAVNGDRIVTIGDLRDAKSKSQIDAKGSIVAPGFIDMLGWSEIWLLLDNRSLSKLSQGITTEITGEGQSIAPQNDRTRISLKPFIDCCNLTIDWATLDGYFRRLEKQGTPLNLGTYVGSGQVRQAVMGDADRAPTSDELEMMKALVEQAMRSGALGVSSALIYPPNAYAKTGELIALAKVAAKYGGLYATHIRSEGASEAQALEEAIRIGREANLPVEVFHLKVSGRPRWGNMRKLVATIQDARESGLDIAANMYPYTAGSSGLAATLPPWTADGGLEKQLAGLKDPTVRFRIKQELASDHPDWDNLFYDCGGLPGVLIASVDNPDLKVFEGKTLEDVSKTWKKSPADTLMDFILADHGQTRAIYFFASEEDLKVGLSQPWTSVGLDAGELSLDGLTYQPHIHPRAFGAMPRFIGHYIRDQQLLPLEVGIRKITSLPAQREHLDGRGLLKPGYFADITIFDPETIIDHATYAKPDQLSEGVNYTIVNGQVEYDHGKLTGVIAGQILRGHRSHSSIGSDPRALLPGTPGS